MPGAAVTPAPKPTPAPTPVPLDPAKVEAGRALFVDVGCDLCHGADAAGTSDAPSLWGVDEEKVREQVRDPINSPGSEYTKTMDPYTTDDLSDAELDAIVSYLLSLGR